MLLEERDGADIAAEKAHIPFVAIEVADGNAGVVLHDEAAVLEQKVAHAREAVFKHQVGRRLEKAIAAAKRSAEFHEGGVRADAAVGNVGGEIVKGLLLMSARVAEVDADAG